MSSTDLMAIQGLLSSFNRWEHWGTERLSKWPKVMHLDRTRIPGQALQSHSPLSNLLPQYSIHICCLDHWIPTYMCPVSSSVSLLDLLLWSALYLLTAIPISLDFKSSHIQPPMNSDSPLLYSTKAFLNFFHSLHLKCNQPWHENGHCSLES